MAQQVIARTGSVCLPEPGTLDIMVKISVLLTRRSDLSQAEFDSYWTDVHTPLLTSVPEMGEFVQRYQQQHLLHVAGGGLPIAPYDGIAEMWVEDIESAGKIFASDSYNTVIAQDEEHFLDRGKTVVLFSEEVIVK
jgi:uncharacterized protein (TIGR02118 family)